MRKTTSIGTRRLPSGLLALLVPAILGLALTTSSASASKQAVAYFGTPSGMGSLGGQFNFLPDIAVNGSGAGVADQGDIYVADTALDRIQRFAQGDNGTPANPYDDTYSFVSAWGADVDGATPGGSDYEICAVAANCKEGVASGGNGAAAGNGSLKIPTAIAVDRDTGHLYVGDGGNARISVYEGDGTFLRSMGWDVVATGPGNTGTGYEVCVAADGDVCKAGTSGEGTGQITLFGINGLAVNADGNPSSGTVFLSDGGNGRISTYNLDGSSPSSFGTPVDFAPATPQQIAVDSRGIVYIAQQTKSPRVLRYDSQGANGGGVGFLAPIGVPPLLGSPGGQQLGGVEVDPDSDGGGPDTDVLYVLRNRGPEPLTVVQQFGPLNAPGLTAPPAADDDQHGAVAGFNFVSSLGFDDVSGRLFIGSIFNVGGPWGGPSDPGNKSGVYVLDKAGGSPSGSLDSISDVTATGATVNVTVEPNGGPTVSYRLEYSLDGSDWTSTPNVVLGIQESPQSIQALLNPLGGLEPDTLYHVRLIVTKAFTPQVVTPATTFTTLPAPPQVETTGSPVRAATTATLEGRVNPRGAPATYHFEYGDQGPCDANPCIATESQAAGSANVLELISQPVTGLQPGTTYHYRVVADNSNPGSPVFGEDMTVTTRVTDAPLAHGDLPGPPGSDRAYEQVNLPDTGGNPVGGALAISDDGERAMYQIFGGTSISTTGSVLSQYFTERTPSGWKTKPISPPRDELSGQQWYPPATPDDLSSLFAPNGNFSTKEFSFWRLSPDAVASKLGSVSPPEDFNLFYAAAADAPTAVAMLRGGEFDPAYPGAGAQVNLYELSSGAPRLASVLPDGTIAECGVQAPTGFAQFSGGAVYSSQWVSADGSTVFFPSAGHSGAGECEFITRSQLYARDLEAETTELISGPAFSGQLCGAAFVKATAGAVFFWTQTRLAAEDVEPDTCSGSAGGDVYRYDLDDEGFECVTCVVDGASADVLMSYSPRGAAMDMAVAADGSRVYFRSAKRLLVGASEGTGTYRVNVETGDLRWIGTGLDVSEVTARGNAISRDGTAIVFRANDPSLNPVGGTHNGGTFQYYRYDDRDRSLICVSCPQDGGAPVASVFVQLMELISGEQVGANLTPISDDGDFLFKTPTPLVDEDQNTPGPSGDPGEGIDVYEWRDGKVLLLSDGITNWPSEDAAPKVGPISRSGRDAFFIAAAQLTPDAIDGYARLYDARIGGGFEFAKPPPPCPLEVCQGTPKGTPTDPLPGTASFSGQGDPAPHYAKAKKKKKRQKRKGQRKRAKRGHKNGRRANHERRNAR